jgi:molybdopterin-guanine dinucleotide biosynthesis protein A
VTNGERPVAGGRQDRLAAGYVLAGGASSRFGQDKALIQLGGEPVLVRMLDVLKKSGVRDLIVVGAKTTYKRFGVRCIEDRWPGEGPLGGIVTALYCSLADKYGYRWNLILSCDMPFLTADWLGFLVDRSKKSEADVVLAYSKTGPEPLCACWKTTAVERLQTAFERGVRKVTDGIALLKAEVLDEKEWKRFDKSGRLFWNMNTPAEYEEARRIVEGKGR